MDIHRKLWNENHRRLQEKLPKALDFDDTKQLLLKHYAMLHSAAAMRADVWSFEDELWQGLSDTSTRTVPPGEVHSIVWCIWHIARIEDATMNLLVADCPLVFTEGGWQARLNVPFGDTGNEISSDDLNTLNQSIDLAALRAYRSAVGVRTQAIIHTLHAGNLRQKVAPERMQHLGIAGVLRAGADGIADYWSRRIIAGLLMMAATRHNFLHLNEAARLKHALR